MIKHLFVYLPTYTILWNTLFCSLAAQTYPIGFSIPEARVVKKIPQKERDFAFIVPGDFSTYIYQDEESYYQGYQRAYFAITCKKMGWDCMRHYEILANGCIPYFVDLDYCPEQTMHLLPKELIKEAMQLKGVSYLHIDHEKFDVKAYNALLEKMLTHVRKHLTTKAMAKYLLHTLHYKGTGKILFLSKEEKPDYLRCLTLAGLKELLGSRVVDVPKISHIYDSYQGDTKQLYGKGMSYTKSVPDLPVDRARIQERIAAKEFDLVIYGSIHRGLPYLDLVCSVYPKEEIVYLCGEDAHTCCFSAHPNLFLREFDSLVEH